MQITIKLLGNIILGLLLVFSLVMSFIALTNTKKRIQGPKGEKGETGKQGEKGEAGGDLCVKYGDTFNLTSNNTSSPGEGENNSGYDGGLGNGYGGHRTYGLLPKYIAYVKEKEDGSGNLMFVDNSVNITDKKSFVYQDEDDFVENCAGKFPTAKCQELLNTHKGSKLKKNVYYYTGDKLMNIGHAYRNRGLHPSYTSPYEETPPYALGGGTKNYLDNNQMLMKIIKPPQKEEDYIKDCNEVDSKKCDPNLYLCSFPNKGKPDTGTDDPNREQERCVESIKECRVAGFDEDDKVYYSTGICRIKPVTTSPPTLPTDNSTTSPPPT